MRWKLALESSGPQSAFCTTDQFNVGRQFGDAFKVSQIKETIRMRTGVFFK